MEHSDFVHLHNHTEYSLLDGACRILDDSGKPAAFLQAAANYKMPALAITDHGNMFGVIEFYQACVKMGIKPIIGCEVYVAPDSRLKKKSSSITEAAYHLTILAKNEIGYKNLIRLVSIGYLEGFYYRPRVDKEVLEKYSEGLIALSGCMKGEIPRLILEGNLSSAQGVISTYQNIFGRDNFYLELQDNGIPEQKKIIKNLIRFGKECNVGMVATNDTHYLYKEDASSHEVLLCIGTGKTIDDPTRLRFSSEEFYFKSPEEMKRLFSYVPEAIRNTIEITEKCNLELTFGKTYLPYYEVPEGYTENSYLEELCWKGAKKRYPQASPQVEQRLRYELDIIKQMDFSAYFLIVWDFIQYAKKREIPVGPGRGSGAGSVVAYTLEITNIDPLKYGLLFERFLNPNRISMPDLDIDFSDEGREKIINYVKNKYGEKNVAQIITFGSMQARLVVRDVGRVLNLPLAQVDRIAKQIPFGESIYSALKKVEGLEQQVKENKEVARLIEISRKLEGLKRHTGVHAAGIVISKDDMTNYVPFARGSKNVVTTQYEGGSLVKLGLLKMDFLGLRNLTVIQKTIDLINENGKNEEIQTENISLTDKKTYQLLCRSESTGVFQLESSGMRDLLRKLTPTEFSDLIALLALYRPGPIGSGMLDEFIRRKHKEVEVTYDHRLLEPILQETYGIVVYQEQVMRIAQDLAGFTPARADILRRAMGKKDPEEMEKQRAEFIKGARRSGIGARTVNKIFNTMAKFGAYGFNKSHSAAYALISYQTAYLKANYPLEYMTTLLNSEVNNTDKIVQYISECQVMGIPILPPSIQESFQNFVIQKEGIRFGLLAIKNVGEGAIASVVETRRKDGLFKSFYDFCFRVDLRLLNKQVIKSMIKAGAFDPLGVPRAELTQELDEILSKAGGRQKDKMIGQTSLFEIMDVEQEQESEEKSFLKEWPESKILAYEKEVLGFYFSGHPLNRHIEEIRKYSTHTISDLHSQAGNGDYVVSVGGIISRIKKITTKKNELMAVCILEDLKDKIEVVIFPKNYNGGGAKYLKVDEIVVVKGKLDRREERGKILADEIIPLRLARERLIKSLYIKIDTNILKEENLYSLKKIMEQHEGNCPVFFNLSTPPKNEVMIDSISRVALSEELIFEIGKIFGQENIEFEAEKF